MGVVYKAEDTELHRTVALKVLPPHLCRQPDYLTRFRAEAQAHARVNDPNIITLYSLLEVPAGEVLVLEYVEGQTLEQRLKLGGPLPIAEAVRLFDQALKAVEHIHAASVVHRDLKPANIYITRDGTVKLMDFGVAKLMDQPEIGTTRTMVGTLLYISPEQINGTVTDFRSDVYTLGVSLFESVIGRLPFERGSDYALMHAHVQEHPPRPKDLRSDIPPALDWVILKAIEKDPSRRFQSASEFRKALLKLGLVERRHPGSIDDVQFPSNIDPSRRPTSRWRGLWVDAALIAGVVALVYVLGIYPNSEPASTSVIPEVNAQAPVTPREAPRVSRPSASPTPKKPVQNNFDSLRAAWGK
jgi:serine/threonine-protein kinase